MNFNIDYLMQHISYELHTIVKNWTDTLSSQTKPEVVCARKDISDEYLPFSVFTDSILNAEDTFNLANNPLIFSAGTADQQIFYAYIAAGEISAHWTCSVFVLYTDEFTYKPAFPGTERSYSCLLLQFLLFLLQCASGP